MIEVTVNGVDRALDLPADVPLLCVLRNDLELNGPKFGCGLGQCGACTILVDGAAARACVLSLGQVAGRAVLTLEGLGTRARPHPVQQAFIEQQAAQCGYCLNGMIMTAKALIDRRADPSEAEVRHALRHNLCRCGAHVEIVRAVLRAAELVRADGAPAP
jgi:nicotinate dehydrogenase subunit A